MNHNNNIKPSESTNLKYTSLLNTSGSTISSNNGSLNECLNNLEKPHMPLSHDQLIPEGVNDAPNSQNKEKVNSYYYVNKNGFSVKVNSAKQMSSTGTTEKDKTVFGNEITQEMVNDKNSKISIKRDELFLSVNNYTKDTQVKEDQQSVTRSVPSQINTSFGSTDTNSSLIQRDSNGQFLINTTLTMQEPNVDISEDHLKYVNLFAILCCWCFPITGIPSIVFSRFARKHYNKRDMLRAKKNLIKSEWMLIITIFFGCTIIGLLFGFLESFVFKNDKGEQVQSGVYRPKVF